MRDINGVGDFKWGVISEGAKDLKFSNGLIVAADAVKANFFYAISEVRNIW